LISIYTDGACKGNPGNGGYAFCIYTNEKLCVQRRGFEDLTTSNRMKLIASVEALKYAKEIHNNSDITIYSDSAYLINCFNDGWIDNWKVNGWKTYRGDDVVNIDLWKTIDNFVQEMNVRFVRVHKSDNKLKIVSIEAKTAIKNYVKSK
jgi:ribonuclease HI